MCVLTDQPWRLLAWQSAMRPDEVRQSTTAELHCYHLYGQ